jgi:hypothetical protein
LLYVCVLSRIGMPVRGTSSKSGALSGQRQSSFKKSEST